MAFRLPQFRTSSPGVNQANQELMNNITVTTTPPPDVDTVKQTPSYTDPISGASRLAAIKADEVINSSKIPLSDINVPRVPTGMGDVQAPPSSYSEVVLGRAEQALNNARVPTTYAQEETRRINDLESASQRLKDPPHGWRKLAAIMGGIGAGLTGGGIEGGFGAYDQIAHGPQMKDVALKQAALKNFEESYKLHQDDWKTGISEANAGANIANAFTNSENANRPQIFKTTGGPTTPEKIVAADKRSGQIVSESTIEGTARTPQMTQTPAEILKAFPETAPQIPIDELNAKLDFLKLADPTLRADEVILKDGTRTLAQFDPSKGATTRYTKPTGEDITDQVAFRYHPPAAGLQLQASAEQDIPAILESMKTHQTFITDYADTLKPKIVSAARDAGVTMVPRQVWERINNLESAKTLLDPVKSLVQQIEQAPDYNRKVELSLQLENYMQTVGTAIARNIGQERGVVTDADRVVAIGLVPGWKSANFAPGFAQEKLKLLDGIVNRQLQVLKEDYFKPIDQVGQGAGGGQANEIRVAMPDGSTHVFDQNKKYLRTELKK